MVRTAQKIRNAVQNVLYKLGPIYCILLGSLFLLFSFIIQLLTSIGVPYIKSFDFLRFDLENFTFVELGMWAACTGRQAITFPTRPDLNEPEAFTCPPASWGWKTLRYSGITNNLFDKDLPRALILHPIACGFTFCAMVAALVTIRRQKSFIILPIFSFLSCLFALAAFFIDVATFVPARHKLMSAQGTAILGLEVTSTSLGPAFWLSLATFCVDIFGNSLIIFGYGVWRYQRISKAQRRSGAYSADMESKGNLSRRGFHTRESVTSFNEAATTGSRSRRGLDDDSLNEKNGLPNETFESRSPTPNSTSRPSEDRRSAPRLSEDRRSIGGTSTYEDASMDRGLASDDDDDDDDIQSARSVYEDAPVEHTTPALTGSRFTRRKPVERY